MPGGQWGQERALQRARCPQEGLWAWLMTKVYLWLGSEAPVSCLAEEGFTGTGRAQVWLVLSHSFPFNPKPLLICLIWRPGSSAGKESACNAGDPGSIPGSGRSPGEGIGYPLQYSWASLVAQLVKNPPANWVDRGSIPGLGRSPEEGKGYPLQYSCLKNSMDCIIWGRIVHEVAKSRTQLSDFHFHFLLIHIDVICLPEYTVCCSI